MLLLSDLKLFKVYLCVNLFIFLGKCENINVGLLQEENNSHFEEIFMKAIDLVNSRDSGIQLTGIVSTFNDGNPYILSANLCSMFQSNVAAIFGPQSTAAAMHAANICDAKEMPYIDTRWDFNTSLPVINIHPHPKQLSIAIKDIVIAHGWKAFTILYETGDFLPFVTNLLEMYDSAGPTISIRRYGFDYTNNYRNILRQIKKSSDRSIIIVGSLETIEELLKQIQQTGLLTEYYRFIVANLDFHNIDVEPFQYSEANITSFRLISPDNPIVQDYMENLNKGNEPPEEELEMPENPEDSGNPGDTENSESLASTVLTVPMALIYDGVLLLEEAFKHAEVEPVPLECNSDSTWAAGYTVVNYLKSVSVTGLTGDIRFDHQGLRTDFELEITELTNSGIHKIATWEPEKGYISQRKPSLHLLEGDSRSLANRSFIVVTALTAPYGMLKETSDKLTGNDQYEGLGIELIHELSRKLGFNYTFTLQEDSVYGSLNHATGEWNGMIRQILDGKADLAIVDLTMTSDRESAVDFTIPFMNLGIAILYKKPMKEPPKLFSFMSPFDGDVWLYLGVAYFSVSLSLFVLGRLSPDEWDNPYPCIQEPTELENQFSFSNSLWFTTGALLQQGSEIAPKATSTRAVASMWWFFTLIMVSSYTANLAAFLTIESLSTPIENAEDLAAGKGGVKYGAKTGGSTFAFFKDAQYPTYKKMYEYMNDHPELMPGTNDEGVHKVETENYAFLMESTSIEYIIERKCTLTQVGSLLDEKGYGIAMKKNWPYRDTLSQAVLELQEQGVLTKMKTKWWKEKRGGGACSSSQSDGGAVALGWANLAGVFVVLILGLVLSVFINIFEMIIDVKQRSKENEVPFLSELKKEIQFVMKCSGNTKIVKVRKPSISGSKHSSISENTMQENFDEIHIPEDQMKLKFNHN